MKLKIRFDKTAIKDFLVDNFEKILFAGVVVGFVVIVYGAVMGRETFDKTPDYLSAEADRARQHWQQTLPKPPGEIRPYDVIVQQIIESPVNPDAYAYAALWKPALWKAPHKRGLPKLFPVQKLRGSAGSGPFEVNTGAGGAGRAGTSSLRGQHWIVLTGLVPFDDQTVAMREAFQNAVFHDAEADTLDYLGYYVERAEVTGPGATDNLNWTTKLNSIKTIEKARTDFGPPSQQVVDPKFTRKKLTFPLGPLKVGHWGREVACPPEIPMMGERGQTAAEKQTATPDTVFGNPASPFDIVRPVPRTAPTGPTQVAPVNAIDKYVLFRFFDYSVEPGKRYRYRVRLVIKNANYGVNARHLEQPDLAKSYTLQTPWTDPTEVIRVPRETRLLAMAVTPPRRVSEEPSSKLMLVQLVRDSGKQAHKEIAKIGRGKVLNYPNCVFPERKPKLPGDKDDPLFEPKKDNVKSFFVDYVTDALTLDMRGGESLAGRDGPTRPGEILLLDPAGNLVVRSEVDDLAEVARLTSSPDDGNLGESLDGPAGASRGSGLDALYQRRR